MDNLTKKEKKDQNRWLKLEFNNFFCRCCYIIPFFSLFAFLWCHPHHQIIIMITLFFIYMSTTTTTITTTVKWSYSIDWLIHLGLKNTWLFVSKWIFSLCWSMIKWAKRMWTSYKLSMENLISFFSQFNKKSNSKKKKKERVIHLFIHWNKRW